MFIIGGLFGSGVLGYYADKTHKFKIILVIIQIGSLVSMVGFALLIEMRNPIIATVLGFMIGFIMIPMIPLGFEFACEVTFPIGEAMSGGLLMMLGQIFGIIHVFLISMLTDNAKNIKEK